MIRAKDGECLFLGDDQEIYSKGLFEEPERGCIGSITVEIYAVHPNEMADSEIKVLNFGHGCMIMFDDNRFIADNRPGVFETVEDKIQEMGIQDVFYQKHVVKSYNWNLMNSVSFDSLVADLDLCHKIFNSSLDTEGSILSMYPGFYAADAARFSCDGEEFILPLSKDAMLKYELGEFPYFFHSTMGSDGFGVGFPSLADICVETDSDGRRWVVCSHGVKAQLLSVSPVLANQNDSNPDDVPF